MSGRFQRFADIERHVERLDSYTGLYHAYAVVFYPKDSRQVSCIFKWAAERKRRVTLRGAGHSFDAQALGNDLVMSLTCMKNVDLDLGEVRNEGRVHVGPGATWGKILEKLERHGFVPAVTVTTEHATAGGTLSANSLSRFSPAYGKEGEWIESFDLVTPDGELHTCTRLDDADSLEGRLFRGVIGGLGYLGAVVSITYDVLYVCQTAGQIGVDTSFKKHDSFRSLANELVPKVLAARDQRDPCDKDKLDSVWAAVFAGPGDRQEGLVFTSSFTSRPDRRPMELHQPGLAFRVLVEWAMTVPPVPAIAWRLAYRFLYYDDRRFIDDLEGFTFFMDGNRRAKRLAKKLLGWTPKTVQQTFIVPSDRGDAGDDLVRWLLYAHDYLSGMRLTPTLQDILWLPKEKLPFRLSATAEGPGFAVSYAFETSDDDVVELAKHAFTEMADVLWEDFGGRVYLVKNVCARPETLAKMYGQNAVEFFKLKNEVDPGHVLVNGFLLEHFEELLGPPSGVHVLTDG